MNCSECGWELKGTELFCPKCGNKLSLKKPITVPRATEMKLPSKPSEDDVFTAMERLMDKRSYQTLAALEKDTIAALKKDKFVIEKAERDLVRDIVLNRGHTGKFGFDDLIIRKLGGGKRAAIIVTLFVIIGGAVLTEILIPMMGERLINEPPAATIITPSDRTTLSIGQNLVLKAEAKDKEDDELLGSNFIWSSSLDGELGVGKSISTDNLSPGTHTISLKVQDSQGGEDIESVVVSIMDRNLLHDLEVGEGFVKIWEPLIDEKAPSKGWLEIENPYYKIRINLDHSYYLLFDKTIGKEVLLYNDRVDNKMDMLTGSDIGYADLDGNNQVPFSTTARDDPDGIRRYAILYEDRAGGFVLIGTEGWDFQLRDPNKGYDVESEVMFGVFAEKPYFIDATEVSNLQSLGIEKENPTKNPNEIVKSWVLDGEYDSASIMGGDREHLNKEIYEPFYSVQMLSGERKPWHAGSAEISKMFPDHVLLGDRFGGAVVFSLPRGVFRWDESQGVYGGQVAAEFILAVEKPEKAVAFSIDPVSRETFLYDAKDYSTIPGYAESLGEICDRYEIPCLGTIDSKDYRTKRFAYVISLTKDWYDGAGNSVKPHIWSDADDALKDFKAYEALVYKQLESTKPLGY